jgi:putative membrane protein
MRARLGIGVAVLVLGVSLAASARKPKQEPVPDAGTDGPPLMAQSPPPAKAPARPDDPPEKAPPMAPQLAVAAADRPTIQRLHDANQMEIQMGRLAQERGASRDVKNYGKRLVADHTAADKKLDDYLRRRGTKVGELGTTSAADPDHELLATKVGAEFDRAFGLQLVADHTKTIEMLHSARIATYDDDLRELYDKMIETQEAHKRAAQDVVASSSRS